MSPNDRSDRNSFRSKFFSPGSLSAPRFLSLGLLLTLAAILADQFAAPILYTTSPLWGTSACLFLIWRREGFSLSGDEVESSIRLSIGGVATFLAAHLTLVLTARSLLLELQPIAGTATIGGTLIAAMKLSVLAPTLLLFPRAGWRQVLKVHSSEITGGIVVLLTYFPRRALAGLWPWYGQLLGRFVFLLSRLAVPGLGYVNALTPTLTGRELDVTLVPECSGINGIELFQVLFGLLVFCDWNRLRKRRVLLGYFAGISAMLLGNALRITSWVVLGNHGLSELVSRFHISAGWIFFSVVFLIFLLFAYRWMLGKNKTAASSPSTGQLDLSSVKEN